MIAARRLQWSIMTAVVLLAPITTADFRLINGPVIIRPSEKEIILQKGQNYTLECIGNREISFKQKDVPEDTAGTLVMKHRNENSENETVYKAYLDLFNVDHFNVGYYACYDDTVNGSEILTDFIEEPIDNKHVSYVYIHVNGSSTLFAPMRRLVLAVKNKFLIECKPTSPDINVTLLDFAEYDRFSPKLGFIIDSDVLSDGTSIFTCGFMKQGISVYSDVIVHKHLLKQPPRPDITSDFKYFLDGDTFTLFCSVPKIRNVAIGLTWKIPGSWSKANEISNDHVIVTDGILYRNITIQHASKEDAGDYVCESGNSAYKNATNFTKIYLDKPMLEVLKRDNKSKISTTMRMYQLRINIRAYPPVNVTVLKDGEPLLWSEKYDKRSDKESFTFKLKQLQTSDSGRYTFRISNGYLTKEASYDLEVLGVPKVFFNINKKYVRGTQVSLECEAEGLPLPQIVCYFSKGNESTIINTKNTDTGLYKITSELILPAYSSGNITCKATNDQGSNSTTQEFLIQEMPDGFGIKDQDKTWFSEGQNVELKCIATKYDYSNLTWYDDNDQEIYNIIKAEDEDSLFAKLVIDNISIAQAGRYTCAGTTNGTVEYRTADVTVARKLPPLIWDPEDQTLTVSNFQPVNMTCVANAVPPPQIVWYKDGDILENNNDTIIETIRSNYTLLNSTIIINRMKKELVGTYECKVSSEYNVNTKVFKLVHNEPQIAMYLAIVGVIIFILILLVVYLMWKIKKEKQFRKELKAAGLLYFKEGMPKSINPSLGIDEQAELLPYDDKFEFPPEKLKLGTQLGAGAFGVVYRAEARGILNAEETTTVAVKMVKKTADNMYIKALATELKIMVHLGRHINIVNLLGACTKNVGKRELFVIVEYCKFGNIHNYLVKHREVFIDQLNDNSEKTMGKVNRGYSCSSANSGLHSDYFGSNHTQETDHTFLNTANTSRSGRKDTQNAQKKSNQMELARVSEAGYIQPEWRSNYESDYSFEGRSPRPLCSRDLLAWSFQIARGMEYLASRKVLHGDLAARNILLAEDNVVKICDFGLARSIYKNDEYQKKENSPLPVKWLAIECMTDRIFSTQSDVWSFGIVLWELFSLAKTPYPNISPTNLLQMLSEGHRLDKPTYADARLYDVMKQCWAQKPNARPTFTRLQELLGSFLEDNVRDHYVDLNAAYIDMNVKRDGAEDYLDRVCAPEYNNIVTPSPHHYVNERSFFPPTPTQLQDDDEGYLQMSPASRKSIPNTRAQGTKFDFDARKLTPRVSEANSYGSESTPMLTLNNLPRSGSESDQEQEGNSSPYLNMCPRIEEEADDVFGTKENNAKNIQTSAVTNPTYITLSINDEKKTNNFANNYINVNAQNGLVK